VRVCTASALVPIRHRNFIHQTDPPKSKENFITFQQPVYVKVQKAHPNVSKPISSTRTGRLGHGHVVGFAGMGEDISCGMPREVLTSERNWG
jgi:hypothetical protein